MKNKNENKPRTTIQRNFFSGTYTETMDGKNRVIVPLVWQHILRDKAVITKDKDGCLCLWTADFFEWYARRSMDSCTKVTDLELIKRLFIGTAKTVDIDSKSRMWIPDELLASFGADGEMYFVGVGDYIEIWTKDLLNSWREDQIIKQTPEKQME